MLHFRHTVRISDSEVRKMGWLRGFLIGYGAGLLAFGTLAGIALWQLVRIGIISV